MSPSDQMKSSAVNEVTNMLLRRLERGGISTSRPEFYFQCKGEEPQTYPGGSQVRVQTWRHWSDARVEINVDSGKLMSWSIVRYSDPANDREISQEEALLTAGKAVLIPADAVLQRFYHFNYAPKHKLARLEWERFYNGLRVDGDYLWVSIHPGTHRIVEFARKWRKLRLP
jgi:hypothetical protein